MRFATTLTTAAFSAVMLFALPGAAGDFDHSGLDQILVKAVKGPKVDYRQVGKRKKELDRYLAKVAAFDTNKLPSPKAKLAFYANAYNALVLNAVVMNRTPPSVMKVKGFFDRIKYKVAGEMMTLNQLEETKLRSSGDPRVHFIVNCASNSCPPLHKRAYTEANIEDLMENLTARYLNRRGEVIIDDEAKTITLVSLFDWYRGDWGDDKGVREFLAHFIPDQALKLKEESYRLRYYEYDWQLNSL
jgi:hypothetical protein